MALCQWCPFRQQSWFPCIHGRRWPPAGSFSTLGVLRTHCDQPGLRTLFPRALWLDRKTVPHSPRSISCIAVLLPYVSVATLFMTEFGRCGVQVPAHKSQRSAGLVLDTVNPRPSQPWIPAFASILQDHFSVRPAYLSASSAEDLAFPACGELLEPVL